MRKLDTWDLGGWRGQRVERGKKRQDGDVEVSTVMLGSAEAEPKKW